MFVKKFWVIFASWWALWILACMYIVSQYFSSQNIILADSFISNGMLALFGFLIANNFRFYLPQQEKYWYLLIATFGFSGLWLAATQWLLKLIFANNLHYTTFVNNSLFIRFIFGFLHIGFMATIGMLVYSVNEMQEVTARKNDIEKEVRNAELYKLRQQLQPHFLFNSLNSINALVYAQPDEARRMVLLLSDFLRGTLKREDSQLLSLKEELEYLKLYLEIEKVRFGHRLQVDFNIDEGINSCTLPPLLLQPLIENAIKFGLYGTTGDVLINLKAFLKDNYLLVHVDNPYEKDMQMPSGTGFGISSVKRRLQLIYQRNDLIEVNKQENIFAIIVKIPLNKDFMVNA